MEKNNSLCYSSMYKDQENKDNFKTGYKPGVDMS